MDVTRKLIKTEEVIKQMPSIYDHFSRIIKCDEMIVTGSAALHTYGLATKVSDIDIIVVRATTEAIEILKKLQEAEESKHLIIEYEGVRNEELIRIMFNGIKIDFFIVPVTEEHLTLANGVRIATISRIINAKKGHNRFKDWFQLIHLAKQFATESEFHKFINSEALRVLDGGKVLTDDDLN